MLRIHGPTYCYNNETVNNTLIYIDDHHWNQESQSFPVEQLIKNNPNNLLVFDHLAHDDILKTYNHVHLPVYLADEVEQFKKQHIIPDWSNKQRVFNFMINKPRANRFRLLELIDQHQLTNYCHSLAWQTSSVNSIKTTDYLIGAEVVLERGVKNGNYVNAMTYQQLLQKNVFEPTCISLITEPCCYEREAMITEKTVMAFYAGTLPLWIGGWKLPDVLRDLGFDVFDDIIDHSYSTLNHPLDRIDQAFLRNKHLLDSFPMIDNYIKANVNRLKHNVELVEKNVFLDVVKNEIKKDSRLQQVADGWPYLIV